MHDVQARALDLALQAVEIARGDGHYRGVQHRRGGALELAGLGIDLVRQRHEGQRRLQCRAERAFVRRIGVGMQQRHRHALHAARRRALHGLGDRVGIGGAHGDARMIDAFGQTNAPLGRDLGSALWRQVEAVEMLAAGAADIEHVLEALGGDQRHGLDAVLDDGVGHQRRAVHQIVDVDGGQARGGKGRLDAGDGIVALGRHLDRAQFAGRGPERHQVGEGAADVDADLPADVRHVVSRLIALPVRWRSPRQAPDHTDRPQRRTCRIVDRCRLTKVQALAQGTPLSAYRATARRHSG